MLNHSDNTAILGSDQPPSLNNTDVLLGDQNLQSRVVEIVMDDSYQAVATVTLADTAENQMHIPGIWYE